MFKFRRRLLALVGFSALALSQVLPVSAGTVSLNSGYCLGSGETIVYSVSASGKTDYVAGGCYTRVFLHVYDPVTATYVYVAQDADTYADSYVQYSDSWIAAGSQHVLRDVGTGLGVTAWSWD